MQTIIKTNPASNFTTFANDLLTSTMPGNAQKILLYLLSKPSNWRLKTHDLRKQLGLSGYAVKKGLRWLCQAGFAAYTRLKSGHTVWKIFDKPQSPHRPETAASPAILPQVEIPKVVSQPVLVMTETETKKETTTPLIPEPAQESIVVVSDSELTFPAQLTQKQKKAAKAIIKKAPADLQQPVLFALAYAITNGKITSSVPGYLQGLVTRANNGTFEPIQCAGASKTKKPSIWQGHKKSPPIDNNLFYQDLLNKFGDKARAAIPEFIKL